MHKPTGSQESHSSPKRDNARVDPQPGEGIGHKVSCCHIQEDQHGGGRPHLLGGGYGPIHNFVGGFKSEENSALQGENGQRGQAAEQGIGIEQGKEGGYL